MAACLSDPGVLAKLKALRGPGESYSDVILRLVEVEAQDLR
jgi:predicted CopG family antitoxin